MRIICLHCTYSSISSFSYSDRPISDIEWYSTSPCSDVYYYGDRILLEGKLEFLWNVSRHAVCDVLHLAAKIYSTPFYIREIIIHVRPDVFQIA